MFSKNLSGIPSECQTVWIQIRPDKTSGLIWVQTVCKGYQQMTTVTTSRERVKIVYGFLKKKKKIQKAFRNTIRVSNSLDPDQARHFVGPDLGPKCLQRLSADDKSHH